MGLHCNPIEMTYLTLRKCIFDFVDLNLAKSFDFEQVAASRSVYRSDRVVAVRLEFRDVNRTDTVCLNRVNINDEAVLSGKLALYSFKILR